jgi:hydroxybutyrate-dimer hydrolase
MTTTPMFRLFAPCAAALLAACASTPQKPAEETAMAAPGIERTQAEADLLSAGLGLAGLRNPAAPAFADPAHPTWEEQRRRSLWTNWRGIADLAPGGGYGEWYGTLEAVPGVEYHGWMRLDGAHQPHRVMTQVPDDFDARKRCLLVTASSGSRGIWGAIALAGAWGLPRGCAVAYTDKGAGTDYEESDGRVSFKHAHSQDNPEADWGRHVRQAAEFGLYALSQARPDQEPFTFENTRVIAAGLSNGGGAVLRAAELEGDWLDGVVAIAPSVLAPEGGRALYDYGTEAGIFEACALADARFDGAPLVRPGGAVAPAATLRCKALRAAGLIEGEDLAAQSASALAKLRGAGWTDAALEAGQISVAFDLWRAVGAAYASAYTRSAATAMPCGYSYTLLDAQGQPRAATPEERAAWFSDASGIPPGAGVMLLDAVRPVAGTAPQSDTALLGLRCLRGLWDGDDPMGATLRQGVAATRAALPRLGLPVFVIHGADDGLVPEAFSGGAYVAAANAAGGDVRYWRVANAQHFDAFLGLPPLATRYVPLLPYAYRALDAMWAHIADGTPLPASADIATTRRAAAAGGIEPLTPQHLAMP